MGSEINSIKNKSSLSKIATNCFNLNLTGQARRFYVRKILIYADTVEARSVLCYWAARGLNISTLELSKMLGI